jgi:hypothetical protein
MIASFSLTITMMKLTHAPIHLDERILLLHDRNEVAGQWIEEAGEGVRPSQ